MAGFFECGDERLVTVECGERVMKEQIVGLLDVLGLD